MRSMAEGQTMVKIVFSFALFSAALGIGGCSTKDVIAEEISPSGDVTARIYQINYGAMADFYYDVELTTIGPWWETLAASTYGAKTGRCASGMDLRWLDDETLAIEYYETKEASFEDSVTVSGQTIRIVPRAGIDDGSPPCEEAPATPVRDKR